MTAPGRAFSAFLRGVLGTVQGRRSAQDITVCDLTGLGVQDAAVAALVISGAQATGMGSELITNISEVGGWIDPA